MFGNAPSGPLIASSKSSKSPIIARTVSSKLVCNPLLSDSIISTTSGLYLAALSFATVFIASVEMPYCSAK